MLIRFKFNLIQHSTPGQLTSNLIWMSREPGNFKRLGVGIWSTCHAKREQWWTPSLLLWPWWRERRKKKTILVWSKTRNNHKLKTPKAFLAWEGNFGTNKTSEIAKAQMPCWKLPASDKQNRIPTGQSYEQILCIFILIYHSALRIFKAGIDTRIEWIIQWIQRPRSTLEAAGTIKQNIADWS